MQHLASLERRARIRTALWLLSAAATIAFALHLGTQSKPLGLLLLVAFALTQLPSLLRQLRFRRLMRSGDLGKGCCRHTTPRWRVSRIRKRLAR
jgi:hypothetical protein